MAAPITHIVLAKKLHKTHFSDKNLNQFIVGTLFPDIRYLGVIQRQKTHYEEMSLDDIAAETDAFTAGAKFHSLVDLKRAHFVATQGVYAMCPDSKYAAQIVKAAEDLLLYKKIADWNAIGSMFDTIYDQELSYNILSEDLQIWHHLLKIYIQNNFDEDSLLEFSRGINLPKDVSEEITKEAYILAKNEEFVQIVAKLYDNFEQIAS